MKLFIDPGLKWLAFSLMEVDEDTGLPVIIDCFRLQKIGYEPEWVAEAGRQVNARWIRNQERKWSDIDVYIEFPAPRWYGRQNQVPLLKLSWQVVNLMIYYSKKARSLNVVNSFDWNVKRVNGAMKGQWNVHEKLEIFKRLFPDFHIGRKKNALWASDDVRDACLMGYWQLMNETHQEQFYLSPNE